MGDNGAQKADVVIDAANVIGVQCLIHRFNGRFPALPPGRELGDHGIVEHGHFAALFDARVHPHPGALSGWLVTNQPPDGRQEVAQWILGVDPGLHRPSVLLNVVPRQGQRFAGGNPNHQLHQVLAGDHLGDRMLHLQTGVHFQKVEVPIRIDDEFHGARRRVVHGPGQGDRLLAHGLAGGGVDEGRRRLLDDLLMAALDRAFPLAKVDGVAVAVRDDLNFDVPRLLDELLRKHPVVAEAGFGLVGRPLEAVPALVVVMHHAHALAAAPGAGLEHDRIADLASDLHRVVRPLNDVLKARNGVDARLLGNALGGDLVAHAGDGVDAGANEGDAALGQGFGELGVLGEKAVARMHRFRAGRRQGVEQPVDAQIAVSGGRFADPHAFIRRARMKRASVRIGINRDRRDAHPPGGPNDPAGDFPAVGDEDLLEH